MRGLTIGFFLMMALLPAVVSIRADVASSSSISTNALQSAANTPVMSYAVRGLVTELDADGKTVVIRHEAVTNYMPAMTMPFEVRNTNELRGIRAGDYVSFEMIVSNNSAWIDQIKKIEAPRPAPLANNQGLGFRLVRDVDPLNIGDLLPEYHFTNEFGRAVSTKDFSGQALVFTFFFTRCPYPAFCPMLSMNFLATETKMASMTNAPTNWHLLSISFDTENDTPATLKEYGLRYNYGPEHWSFVTGDLMEITAIGDQVGESFGHDETGGITHKLRTVVVDARGRIQKVWTNNNWTPDDLVAEILKAAKVKE
jgi:protein SCO1/2